MIKCIIFDMDGTILDSMHVWENLGANFLKKHGKEPEDDLNEQTRGMSVNDTAKYILDRYGIENVTIEEFLKEIFSEVEQEYFYTLPLKDGVLEVLRLCADKGIKLCVATANERFVTERALERTGALKYLDLVITCTEVGAGKERADVFLYCTQKLGLKPCDTVVFEDSLPCALTAKKAGFKTVAVRDNCTDEQWEEFKNMCDYGIESFGELL